MLKVAAVIWDLYRDSVMALPKGKLVVVIWALSSGVEAAKARVMSLAVFRI